MPISRAALEERNARLAEPAQEILEAFLERQDLTCQECGAVVQAFKKNSVTLKAALEVLKMAGVGPIHRIKEEKEHQTKQELFEAMRLLAGELSNQDRHFLAELILQPLSIEVAPEHEERLRLEQ
jgi:hypothetical protein